MPRPKGSQNRNSRKFLHILTKDHNFDIIKKLVNIYNVNEEVYLDLMGRMQEAVDQNINPVSVLTAEENSLRTSLGSEIITILKTMVAYAFPKMKALEVANEQEERISFNINIPAVGDKAKASKKMITSEGKASDCVIDVNGVTVGVDDEEEDV